MNDRDAPGQGAIFPNRYKEEGDKKPTLKGHVFAHRDLKAGERIELALWPHKTGGGYSIKCSEPRSLSQEAGMQQPAGTATAAPMGDDTIPFAADK